VIWTGNGGSVIFFQNEMPYDPPGQTAWMEAPGVLGLACTSKSPIPCQLSAGWHGQYSFFNQGLDIFASNGVFSRLRGAPLGSLHDLLTIFLDPSKGRGGILTSLTAWEFSTIGQPRISGRSGELPVTS